MNEELTENNNLNIDSLIADLKLLGVEIIGDEKKMHANTFNGDFRSKFFEFATQGRSFGVRFSWKDKEKSKDSEALVHKELLKYGFKESEASIVINNIQSKKAGVKSATKSETVRAEFTDADYLAFNELHSRIIFSEPDLSARQTREESVKFAVNFTTQVVKLLAGSDDGGLFIDGNPDDLMRRFKDHIGTPKHMISISKPFYFAMEDMAAKLLAEKERLQAKIDALMFEYCQGEMSKEQLANYEKFQKAASVGICEAIDSPSQKGSDV